jgi:hypothetical protein
MSPDTDLLVEFGRGLYEAFLTGTARRLFDQTWGLGAADPQVVLRLLVEEVQLAALPWELLYRPDPPQPGFLALSPRRPFIRDVALPEPAPPLQLQIPLRILVVLSNPFNDLDIGSEKGYLNDALVELIAAGQAQLSFLENPSSVALNKALLRGEPTILHYAGHGGFDVNAGQGYLLLQGSSSVEVLLDSALAEMVEGTTVQLAVLDACETGHGGRQHAGLGIAPMLIRQARLPAVVGMQFAISDRAAAIFTREFYTALTAPQATVESTLSRTRVRLAHEMGLGSTSWVTPVLWMRAQSGHQGRRMAGK